MKPETIYKIIGVIWGTLLGVFTGFTVSMAVFNVLWAVYTGDSTGQEGILTSAKSTGLVIIGLFGIAGLSAGHYLTGQSYLESKKKRVKIERKKLSRLLLFTVCYSIVSVAPAVYFYNSQLNINELRQRRLELRSINNLDSFIKDRLKISRVDPLMWKDGTGFDLKLVIVGKDAGDYLLKTIVYEQKKKQMLFAYTETAMFDSKTTLKIIPVRYSAVISAFLETVSGKKLKFPLKEKLGIIVTLEPLLDTKAKPGYYYNALRDVKYLELPLVINTK